jgi:hypothetical protein
MNIFSEAYEINSIPVPTLYKCANGKKMYSLPTVFLEACLWFVVIFKYELFAYFYTITFFF